MTPFRENLRGIAYITACNLLFLFNDTIVKLVSADLPLGEIIFIRGAMVTVLLAPIVVATGAHHGAAALLFNRPVFWRTAAEAASAFLYLFALLHMPIGNLNVILQVVPLAVTAAGAILFAEAVGWRRWTAIAVGFAGVLIIVRPGLAGFNGYSLLALASTLVIALRDVSTRLMPRGLSALLVSLVTGAVVGLCGPLFSLAMGEVWVMPSIAVLGAMLLCGLFIIGGYITSVAFMRHGDISVVAPFRYVAIFWAILIGFLVWHEVPDLATLIGMAIIAASGIYTFRRERNLARLQEEAAADAL